MVCVVNENISNKNVFVVKAICSTVPHTPSKSFDKGVRIYS